jgi:hypothetical protein
MRSARITLIAIFCALAASSQVALVPAPQDSPVFEVASVKPADPNSVGSSFNFAPGSLRIEGGTLRRILEMAYNLRTLQILGGPP